MDTTHASSRATLAVRPLETDDLDGVGALERSYAARHGCPSMADGAALRHYARGGHAFVARRGDETCGVVFAHAVWDGARPALRAVRLAAGGDDATVLERLVGAVVKSAYDAAVYDLVFEIPESDGPGRAAVEANAFAPAPIVRFERVLGSRAARSP